MLLAPNFTLDELARTSHRGLAAENLRQARNYLSALLATAAMLQRVRDWFGKPIFVHSGFRSLMLNEAVGGSAKSQHTKGEAADFHVHEVPLQDVWLWIWKESGLPFGQLILEGWEVGQPTWIHLSLGAPWRDPKFCGRVLTFEAGHYQTVDVVAPPKPPPG